MSEDSESDMSAGHGEKRLKRQKHYKLYLKSPSPRKRTPKSTAFRWKKKKKASASANLIARGDSSNSDSDNECIDSNNASTCVSPATSMHVDGNEIMGENLQDSAGSISPDTSDTGTCSEDDSSDSSAGEDDAQTMPVDMAKEPIYPGCPISVAESLLLTMKYAMTHNLSASAVTDLLILEVAHIPEGCHMIKTLNNMKHQLANLSGSDINLHHYCWSCKQYLSQGDNSLPTSCPKCRSDVKKDNYFITLSLEAQLQNLFSDSDFCEGLSHRYTRKKMASENLEDVYDGEVYKNFIQAETDHKYNLSLKFNTDGVCIFKSSAVSIWPIYFMINELSPEMRKKSKYMLFGGLWFSKFKPSISTFLAPIVKQLQQLEMGVSFKTANNVHVVSKIFVLSGHFDTPAKSLVLEHVQFNGRHGCTFCCEPGCSFKTSARGHSHIYPFNDKSDTGFEGKRSHASVMEAAEKAASCVPLKPVTGVKGKCPLAVLKHFDIVDGIAFDYMHTVALGVMKMLLTLWFNSQHHAEAWYIGKKVSDVDKRLLSIKPPNSITRTPRPLSALKHYKASEFGSWLFHYGLPCLQGILPLEHFQHFSLLVEGIYLLNKSSISVSDVNIADVLLIQFCKLMPKLYGPRRQTINVHLLLHASSCVVNLGPLWSISCYVFEGWNGDLSNYFHGTQNIPIQILASVSLRQKVQLLQKNVVPGSPADVLISKLANRHKAKLKEHIGKCMYVVGGYTHLDDCDPDIRTILEEKFGKSCSVSTYRFLRIFVNSSVYHSRMYYRATKRNSFTVCYYCQDTDATEFGVILYYLKVNINNTNDHYFAVICKLKRKQQLLTGSVPGHIVTFEPSNIDTDEKYLVDIVYIQQKCVYMEFSDVKEVTYVSPLPNLIEAD